MVSAAGAVAGRGDHAVVAFIGAIGWTVYMSLTRSRRFAEYEIDWSEWARQYERLFKDDGWQISLQNLVILGIGSTLAIVFGFVLAALIDREKRGEGFFRTVFLYPLAVSLIVTGVAWRWMFNPQPGAAGVLPLDRAHLHQLRLAVAAGDGDVRHHPRLYLAGLGLLHGPDAVGPEIDQHRDLERRRASTA